jgi:hypothetical protein
MDLVVFENDKPYVISEFREGRFDYIELASEVAETKFFQFLFGQGLVDQLAQDYPSPRKRHHVPLWMYVSSQLALRLHGSHSFHSYPLIIRAGGLIEALGPDVATRKVDSQSGDMSIHCEGFNHRNLYSRETPCDQDYLRKLAKDTDPQKLEQWYNHHVARLYGQLNAYDEEGIFIGDGSYLFVPNNKNYEGSKRLLFDEHNHPVSKEEEKKMTPAQRERCQWRRCYRVVFLLHCDRAGERFLIAGLRVLRADQAEGPALWELLDTFVGAVGRGVLKKLIVDRGFIDGPQIGKLQTEYGVDTVIPVRKNMDILQDVRGIVKLGVRWEEYQRPRRAPLIPPRPQHPTAAKREKARQKTLAKRHAQEQRQNPPDPRDVLERTLITKIPELTSWSDCPVPLTGVYSKDCYADGHEKDWLLVTTDPHATASGVRDDYALRTDVEELHRQVKCFWDLTRFPSTAWNVIVGQTVFVALTYSLLQIHLLQQGHQELNRRTVETSRRLLPDGDRVIIYRQQRFAFFTLLEHTELTLSLTEKARRKALAKARRLRKEDHLT